MLDIQQTIRERAYQLWIEGGRQDGYADAHWLAAQRNVLSISLGEFGLVTVAETPDKAIKTKTRRKLRFAYQTAAAARYA